jgi:hypothetical protein
MRISTTGSAEARSVASRSERGVATRSCPRP